MMRLAPLAAALAAVLALGACVMPAPVPGPTPAPVSGGGAVPVPVAQGGDPVLAAVARIEPVAEAICRARVQGRNCDFAFALDDRANQPANAFQTLDETGRPFVVLTRALVGEMTNSDELAFVLGHEAAHHIAGHIPRRQDQALSGAILAGVIATASGLSPEEVRAAQDIGADLAARQYSKEFELEADALGAEIALAAGYDPVRGAAFFARLPDPGDQFLGTHPPNAQRQETVSRTVRRLTAR